jgi:hypothetical protein
MIHSYRRRGLGRPVVAGCAEQSAGAAGTGFAHRRSSPGVAAVTAVADAERVAAGTAVTALPAGSDNGVSSGAAATAVADDQPTRAALTAGTAGGVAEPPAPPTPPVPVISPGALSTVGNSSTDPTSRYSLAEWASDVQV